MNKRIFLFGGGLCFALGFLLAGVRLRPFRWSEEVPKYGGTLHVCLTNDANQPNLDPAAGAWVMATEQIFDGLVLLDANLDPKPALAEFWRPEDDGRTTVFLLRKGVQFHNGHELTSDDVKFSLERILRPEVRSPFAGTLAAKVAGAREFQSGKAAGVAGFVARDKYVFEIHWLNPNVAALYLLSTSYCKILPQEEVIRRGRKFFWEPVGTGPFKVESYLRNTRLDIIGLRLERNNGYFGKAAYVSALELSPLFTTEHFMNREVEIVPYVSDRLARSGCQVVDAGPQSIGFLLMSCGVAPLNRAAIRQALSCGIDKERLADAFRDSAFLRRTTNNVIPARWPGFFPRADTTGYNPGRGLQILEEQGFSAGKKFPEVVLFLPQPKTDGGARFADELERQLGRLGIPMSVSAYRSLGEIRDLRRPSLILANWPIDDPDPEHMIRSLFQFPSDLDAAHLGYDNPRLDRFLDEAAAERSMTRRTELFRRIEDVLAEDVPALPLFITEPRIALQPQVRGVKASPRGYNFIDLKDIWLEKRGPRP